MIKQKLFEYRQIISAGLMLAPVFVSAQTVQYLVETIRIGIFNPIISLLLTAAVAAFFWGVVKYIWGQSSDKNKKEAKEIMLWGVIALFVMVSVWGIVNLIIETFDLGGIRRAPTIPRF